MPLYYIPILALGRRLILTRATQSSLPRINDRSLIRIIIMYHAPGTNDLSMLQSLTGHFGPKTLWT